MVRRMGVSWLYLLSSASLGLAFDYSAIDDTGKNCTSRDSCRQTRNTRGPIEVDWKKRNCFCDNDCARYGDCCIDAPAFDPQEQRDHKSTFDCANMKQYGDIYIRSRCPEGWHLPSIQTACEQPNLVSDPFGTTPVTQATSGVTYRNYYCAVCNRDAVDIQFWKPRLECPTLTGYSNRFQNLTMQFIFERLKFDPGRGQWGVEIDTGGIFVFHECFIDPSVPDQLLGSIRTCPGSSTIMDCPASYANDTVRELCLSYTGLVFEPNASYRNVHCAICNQADLERLICLDLSPFGRVNWQQNFNFNSFAVLFDLGGSAQDSVGFTGIQCLNGQVFDPFFKKCRSVVCPIEGEIFVDGDCVNPQSQDEEVDLIPELIQVSTGDELDVESLTPPQSDLPTNPSIPFSPPSTTTVVISTTSVQVPSSTSSPTPSSSVGSNFFFPVFDTDSVYFPVEVNTSPPPPNRDSTQTSNSIPDSTPGVTSSTMESSSILPLTSTISVAREDHTHAPNFAISDIGDDSILFPSYPSSSSSLEELNFTLEVITTTEAPETTTIGYSEEDEDIHVIGANENVTRDDLEATLSPSQMNFLQCPKVQLERSEYDLQQNGTIFIKAYNQSLSAVEFQFVGSNQSNDSNASIWVCVLDTEEVNASKFGMEMGVITLLGLGLSTLCLVLHIITFILAPELQNLSGKNLVSLSASLLGGYISFISAMFMKNQSGSAGCYTLAVFMYFFFLSAFLWMFIIAWDVFHTLRLATTKLRLSSGTQWKKFGWYAMIAWGVPFILVMISLITDFSAGASPFSPGFGQSDLCWFSNKQGLLLFFAIPMAILMVCNIVFFVLSAGMVYDTTKNTSKVSSCGPKTNFHLYLKLAVLMGLTWIIGLVAGFLNMNEIWYAFVAFNTLQGVFIFVAFSCNQKVFRSVRATMKGRSPSSASWSSKTRRSDVADGTHPREALRKKGKRSLPDFPVRGKTVYTVSNYQVNQSINQNSFDGRYF